MSKYVIVIDKTLSDTLLSKGFKLLNHNNLSNLEMWTFENAPHLFSFEGMDVSDKYIFSDTLKLNF